MKAFVIYEKSLRDSFHGERIQSHLHCRKMAVDSSRKGRIHLGESGSRK